MQVKSIFAFALWRQAAVVEGEDVPFWTRTLFVKLETLTSRLMIIHPLIKSAYTIRIRHGVHLLIEF